MNKIKILMPLACFGLLVSCNKDMPTISDEAAKKIAIDMVTRHSDSTLFSLPENYARKDQFTSSNESKTPDGSTKTSSTGKRERYYAYYNLRFKEVITNSNNTSSSTKISYIFYDKAREVRIHAYNNNGYKYRYEYSSSLTSAQSYFTDMIRAEDRSYIIGYNLLNDFSNKIDSYKTSHEKYKNESDQHYNYSIGSSDMRSLQLTTDSKLKSESSESNIKYTGYIEEKTKSTIKNDLCVNESLESKTYTKSENGMFHKNITSTTNCEISYGGVSIDIPNINEYELKS